MAYLTVVLPAYCRCSSIARVNHVVFKFGRLLRRYLAARLDPAAPVVPLQYQPALQAYPPLPERPLQNWPEANRLVGDIGGWRVYANEPWEQPKSQSDAPVIQGGAAHADH